MSLSFSVSSSNYLNPSHFLSNYLSLSPCFSFLFHVMCLCYLSGSAGWEGRVLQDEQKKRSCFHNLIFTSIVPILQLASSGRSLDGRGTEERVVTDCFKLSVPSVKTWKETLRSKKKTVRKSSLKVCGHEETRTCLLTVYCGKRSNKTWLLIPANWLIIFLCITAYVFTECLLHAGDCITKYGGCGGICFR